MARQPSTGGTLLPECQQHSLQEFPSEHQHKAIGMWVCGLCAAHLAQNALMPLGTRARFIQLVAGSCQLLIVCLAELDCLWILQPTPCSVAAADTATGQPEELHSDVYVKVCAHIDASITLAKLDVKAQPA